MRRTKLPASAGGGSARAVPAALAAALLATAFVAAPPAGAASRDGRPPSGELVVASSKAPPAAAKAAPDPARDPLAELARSKRRVVIADFGMGMCKQCKRQGEILEEVKKAYGEKVEVRFVHVGKEAELAERYEVSMIPHLVYLDPSGTVRGTATGVSSFEKVADQLAKMGVRR